MQAMYSLELDATQRDHFESDEQTHSWPWGA